MALVGQNQQTAFSSPQNGQAPDADVVRGNDNAIGAKHNAHDADATIHVQTGLLAARPAASTPYAMYVDENKRLYVDNGTAWAEVPYARLDASGTNAFSSNVTVGGTLGVSGLLTASNLDVLDVDAADIVADSYTGGPLTVTGNSLLTGALVVTGGVAAGGTVAAAAVSGNGSALTNLSAAAITTGQLDSARLPTTVVTATIAGAAATPRNTIKLGDSDTLFLTTTATSTLVKSDTGAGTTATITGFNGPTGTSLNASAVRYIPVSIAGSATWYIPVFQFT